MLVAVRSIEASYEGFGALLDRSVRSILRGDADAGRLEALRSTALEFVGKLARVNARAAMGAEKADLEALWTEDRFSPPLAASDRELLVAAIEHLEASLSQQRASLRRSFNSLLAAVCAALLVSLAWSATLWHRYRLSLVDASWGQRSMRQALQAEEETKKRIARDLHDDASQDIAAARMLCERASAAGSGAASGLGAEAAAILAEAGKKLRLLAQDIRPPELEHSGLLPALEALCARNSRLYGKEIGYRAAGRVPRLADEAALQTYRIVQEAISNSIRHAPGSRIELGVEAAFRFGRPGLLIRVEDVAEEGASGDRPGGAVPVTPERGGLGMAIMRERASYVRGGVEVERGARGLAVSVFVPSEEGGEQEHA